MRILLPLLSALGLSAACAAQPQVKTLEPADFQAEASADQNKTILDVRTPAEYDGGHLANAANLDWQDRDAFDAGLAKLSKGPTYYVYCRSGRRSAQAAAHMLAQGFKVVNMAGGILAWNALALPAFKTGETPRIKIYGMPTCPDCAHAKAQLTEADTARYQFIDIGSHVRLLKEFLRLRDHSRAFSDARQAGRAGIPCFVLPDGTVTLTPEDAGLSSRDEDEDTGAACNIDGTGC